MSLTRAFIGFAVISGIGWLCDFLTFSILANVFFMKAFWANFVSSYVGVTFVWFTSLKTLFRRSTTGSNHFLVGYWFFQFVSILLYSQLLQIVAGNLAGLAVLAQSGLGAEILAKIIITPFNLVTNFIFMKLLTRRMPGEKRQS